VAQQSIWYQTSEGYIHSAFVAAAGEFNRRAARRPSRRQASGAGQRAIAETRLKPAAAARLAQVYYGSVYRAVDAVQMKAANGGTGCKTASRIARARMCWLRHCRYLSPAALAPISSDRTDKKIVVDLARQEMTVSKGETAGSVARTATVWRSSHAARRA